MLSYLHAILFTKKAEEAYTHTAAAAACMPACMQEATIERQGEWVVVQFECGNAFEHYDSLYYLGTLRSRNETHASINNTGLIEICSPHFDMLSIVFRTIPVLPF